MNDTRLKHCAKNELRMVHLSPGNAGYQCRKLYIYLGICLTIFTLNSQMLVRRAIMIIDHLFNYSIVLAVVRALSL